MHIFCFQKFYRFFNDTQNWNRKRVSYLLDKNVQRIARHDDKVCTSFFESLSFHSQERNISLRPLTSQDQIFFNLIRQRNGRNNNPWSSSFILFYTREHKIEVKFRCCFWSKTTDYSYCFHNY